MNVTCPECRSVFRVDPAKVPSMSVRARCSVCGGVITVAAGSSSALADEFGPAPSASRAGDSGGAKLPTPARPTMPIPARPVAPTPVTSASPIPWSPPLSRPPLVEPRGEGMMPSRPTPASPQPPVRHTPVMPMAVGARPLAGAGSQATPPLGRAAISPAATGKPAAEGGRPPFILRPPVGVGGTQGTRPPGPIGARPVVAPQLGRPATPASTMRMPTPPAGLTPPSRSTPQAPVASAATPPAARAAAPTTVGIPTPSRPPINPFLANDPNAKAKRLARALVSDLVTYFPRKREEGVRDGTLKQLFREEIQKSYEEYVMQVGREFAESTPHFQEALNDILAGGQRVF